MSHNSMDNIFARRVNKGILVYVLPIAFAVAATLFYAQFWLSHDDSWYLVATRKFIDGQQLYLNIIEINPPLNFYLTAPALYFADLTKLSDTVAYIIQTCLLSGLSGAWLTRIVTRCNLNKTERVLLLGAGLSGLFILPIAEFAQREHLLLIFALPYFYLTIIGAENVFSSSKENFVLGLFATLGIALKPHFLIIPLAIALIGSPKNLHLRLFAPANLGLAVGLIGYALFVILMHANYFTLALGIATKVYSAYGAAPQAILWRPETIALLMFVSLFITKGIPIDEISRRLTAAASGSLIAYLTQFKGWNYHLIPFSFFLPLGAIWIAKTKGVFAERNILNGVFAVVIVILTLGIQLLHGPYNSSRMEPFSQFVEKKGERIVVYSTNVWAAFPFVNAVDGVWSSRYPAQWMIPGAYKGLHETNCEEMQDRCIEYASILSDVRKADVEDFLIYKPELVYIDVRKYKSYFGNRSFDYLEFLQLDPAFSEAWANCRKVGFIENYAYDVWRCHDTIKVGV